MKRVLLTKSALHDLLILFTIAFFAFVLALIFDVCETLIEFTLRYKAWHMDEIWSVLILLGFTSSIYFLRRGKQLRKEINQRKFTENLLEGQNRILEMVASGVELPNILAKVVGVIRDHSSEAACCIMLWEHERNILRIGASSGLLPSFVKGIDGIPINPSGNLCWSVCTSGKPIFVADISNNAQWSNHCEVARNHNLRACWCIPIYSSAGNVVGILSIYFETPKSPESRDINLIETTARLAGIAIERCKAEESLRQYAGRLEILREIDQAILSVNTLEDILSESLFQIRTLLPVDWAGVALFNQDTTQIQLFASSDNKISGMTELYDLPYDQNILYEYNNPIEDLEQYPENNEFLQILREQGLRSLLYVPLISGVKVVGSLLLANREPGIFNVEQKEIAREVSIQLAVAIQHARLFDQLQNTHQRLQSMSHKLVETQELERRHIARELHDQIGQALTALKINLQISQKHTPDQTLQPYFEDNIGIIEQTLQQVRNLSLDLRPSILDDLGLVAALRWYINRFAQRSGVNTQLESDHFEFRLQPELETTCFRIVQEALTNIARHAEATTSKVSIHLNGTKIELKIIDNGKGFEVKEAISRAEQGMSLGVLGMEERATLLGGSLKIESTPNKGTCILAEFPLQNLKPIYHKMGRVA
ncbi:MAG: GAF domain-containing sensor histidine kinase [Chloroflexi bacterium]|uniref:histidine kinase n=1 Tax=Candidatus Chlorohelix allophototropha TaxID=3003348 RepID=A0A8T7LRI0_9CHLR|nr:GAF domain-containing sensor histidine kinase [Chloroflexota bacterium]WJW66487.1 GAF domain-containing sensor histidine kinase [Chloroflexota bacterium L227-S17]